MRALVTGILKKLVVFLFWNLLSVGVLFLPVHALVLFALELVVVVAFVRRYLVPPRRDVALGRTLLSRRAVLRLRAVPRDAWPTVAAWVAATVVLDQLVTMVYFPLVPRAADYPNPFPDLLDRPLGWLPLALAVLVAAPLLEEVTFRGWVQRPLERWTGASWAIGITSLLFAGAHGFPLLIPYYFVAGIALGASAYLTRSLWVAILAHAAHNLWSGASDRVGLTNQAAIEWGRQPLIFAASAVGLVLWVAMMVWLGGRVRAATRPPLARARRATLTGACTGTPRCRAPRSP